jgi:hypothetical protein
VPERKYDTPVSFETLEVVKPLSMRVVCLASFNQANAFESHIVLSDLPKNQRIVFNDEFIYKVFSFKYLLENQRQQL